MSMEKMAKKARILAVPLFALLSISSPVHAQNPNPNETEEREIAVRVAELKKAIRNIAVTNMDRRDNTKEVREELEPIVAELKAYYNIGEPLSAESNIPMLVGVWRQLWTDNLGEDFPPFRIDRSKAFQVISSQGYFYNIAPLQVGQNRNPLTIFLRGEYKPQEEHFNLKFTSLRLRLGDLQPNENLMQVVERIEARQLRLFEVPSFGGRGPVGNEGKLANVYLDDDFRIALGTGDEEGETSLYVAEKVSTAETPPAESF